MRTLSALEDLGYDDGIVEAFPAGTWLVRVDMPDRDEYKIMVRSGDIETLEVGSWRRVLGATYRGTTFGTAERALHRHWWRLAHERGGFS